MRHEKIQQTIIHTPNIRIMTLDLEYNGNMTLVVVICSEYEYDEKIYNGMISRVAKIRVFWEKILDIKKFQNFYKIQKP